MNRLYLFFLIIIISIIEYIGDSHFKSYARSNDNLSLIIGLIAYIIMIYLLILSLKNANLVYINGMWDGISTLIETLLAMYLLHETLSNGIQYIGLFFIILGIFTLNYGNIPY